MLFPATSTRSPTLNSSSTLSCCPGLYSSALLICCQQVDKLQHLLQQVIYLLQVVRLTLNSVSLLIAGAPAFFRWLSSGLVTFLSLHTW